MEGQHYNFLSLFVHMLNTLHKCNMKRVRTSEICIRVKISNEHLHEFKLFFNWTYKYHFRRMHSTLRHITVFCQVTNESMTPGSVEMQDKQFTLV